MWKQTKAGLALMVVAACAAAPAHAGLLKKAVGAVVLIGGAAKANEVLKDGSAPAQPQLPPAAAPASAQTPATAPVSAPQQTGGNAVVPAGQREEQFRQGVAMAKEKAKGAWERFKANHPSVGNQGQSPAGQVVAPPSPVPTK